MLKSWIIYVVLLIICGLINRIKPGYASSISFYIVLLTPLVSLLHVWFSFAVFKLVHEVDKRQVSKGDEIVYKIKLINPTAILLAPFSLHYIGSEQLFKEAKDEIDHQIIITERKRVVLRKHLKCAYRGNYTIGVDKIVIRDFFNFYRFSYTEIEQHKILVYPKLRELKSHLLRQVVNESNESVISNDAESQSIFTDIRKYVPGDPLNRIHWKLSAKAGEFMSKDYSGQMTNNTKVFLDSFNLDLDDESSIVYEDYLVEGCVSVIHFLLENRVNTQLFYEHFGIVKVEGRSSNDFPRFFEELAGLSFFRERHLIETLEHVLQIEQDSCHVIVMTQQINLQLAELLIKLKYRNFEISVIVCDHKSLGIKGIDSFSDHKSQFMLTTSKIPIYFMQHDESSTRLGVS